ncbi:MAG: hypothetical protein ACREAS_01125 [Nitrososphaera sp.]
MPQDGVLQQQQPADEEVARIVEHPTEDETIQPTQEPLPCPEGQVLDEDSGLCVLAEEPEVQEPQESQPEEEQCSEEGEGSA